MRLHPRHDLVTKAEIDIKMAVTKAIGENQGLTHAELAGILAGIIVAWNKYAIRDEREADPDAATGTADDSLPRSFVDAVLERKETRNSLALTSFTEYCRLNPEQRFWQALRNWSKWSFILAAEVRDGATLNTFNVEGLDGTRTAAPLPRAVVDAPKCGECNDVGAFYRSFAGGFTTGPCSACGTGKAEENGNG